MRKIVLWQHVFTLPPPGVSEVEYEVVRLVGLTQPRIGTILQERTVNDMLQGDFRKAPYADEIEII